MSLPRVPRDEGGVGGKEDGMRGVATQGKLRLRGGATKDELRLRGGATKDELRLRGGATKDELRLRGLGGSCMRELDWLAWMK